MIVPTGRFTAYQHGKVIADAILGYPGVVKLMVGTEEAAKRLFVSDVQFLDTLEAMVQEATWK